LDDNSKNSAKSLHLVNEFPMANVTQYHVVKVKRAEVRTPCVTKRTHK